MLQIDSLMELMEMLNTYKQVKIQMIERKVSHVLVQFDSPRVGVEAKQ